MKLPSLIVSYPIRDKKMPGQSPAFKKNRVDCYYFLAPGPLITSPLLM